MQWTTSNYVAGLACSLYSATLLNSFFNHKLIGDNLLDFLDKPFHHLNEIFQPGSFGKGLWLALPYLQAEITANSSPLASPSLNVKCSFIASRGACGQLSNRRDSPGLLAGAAVEAQVSSAPNMPPSHTAQEPSSSPTS